jgi:hypothetical protein
MKITYPPAYGSAATTDVLNRTIEAFVREKVKIAVRRRTSHVFDEAASSDGGGRCAVQHSSPSHLWHMLTGIGGVSHDTK